MSLWRTMFSSVIILLPSEAFFNFFGDFSSDDEIAQLLFA